MLTVDPCESADKHSALSQLSDEQLTEFRKAFELFDKDGDGSIEARELTKVMRSLGQNPSQKEIAEMIEEVDEDQSGAIEFNEFVEMIAKRSRDVDCEEQIRNAFQVFDRDGSGSITVQELRQVMCNFGDGLTAEDIDEMMSDADTNGDGEIQYDEFVAMICSEPNFTVPSRISGAPGTGFPPPGSGIPKNQDYQY